MKMLHTIATALLIGVTLNACTPKMTFVTSTIVPSATGTVSVKKDRNNNYITNVNVINLADPKKLTPSKNTYLVWMESNNESAKKLGQLTPTGKTLKGILSGTSVAKPDVVFITAEDDADIRYPDGPIILTTKQ